MGGPPPPPDTPGPPRTPRALLSPDCAKGAVDGAVDGGGPPAGGVVRCDHSAAAAGGGRQRGAGAGEVRGLPPVLQACPPEKNIEIKNAQGKGDVRLGLQTTRIPTQFFSPALFFFSPANCQKADKFQALIWNNRLYPG